MRSARDYQIAALDGGDVYGRGVFAEWNEHRSTLINIPTGAGKTFCSAEIIKRQLGRVMFIVHLKTIITQSAKEIHEMTGFDVGIEMAQRKSKTLAPEPIVVASVQTLGSGNRLEKFDPFEFTLLICDEAHHSSSASQQKIISYFEQNPNLKILYLTATPERGDKQKLSHFESVAYSRTLQSLVDEGWLVRPFQRIIEVPGLDLSAVRKLGQDLNQKDLEEAMIKVAVLSAHRSLEAIFGLYPHELEMIPESEWRDYIGGRVPRRTLAFCVGRLHAKKVAEALNAIYPGLCGYVDGETDGMERLSMFERFKNGNLYCLSNCGVMLEGYDNPNIEVILILRPTRSRPLFLQAIGRGTRALKGVLDGMDTPEDRKAAILASAKKNIEIVDFTGNSGKIRLVSLIDVFGEPEPFVRRELEKRAKEKAIDVEKETELILEEEQQKIELRATNFREHEIDGFTGKKKKKKLTKEQKAERAEKLAKRGLNKKEFERLSQQKLQPEHRTLEENRQLLKTMTHRRLAGLCTYRQGYTLRKNGFAKNEIERMSFGAASAAIDAIAKNGWRPLPRKPEPTFTERMMNDSAKDYETQSSFGEPVF